MSDQPGFQITQYTFEKSLSSKLEDVQFAQQFWPIVYILSDGFSEQAYVGETTDAISRMSAHFRNAVKSSLISAHLIHCDNSINQRH